MARALHFGSVTRRIAMNFKTLITTAALVVGSSAAAFAGPKVEVVHDRAPTAVRVEPTRVERGHGPVVVNRGPVVVNRGPVVINRGPHRPTGYGNGYGHGPVVIHRDPIVVRPVWNPIIRPITRPVIVTSAPVGTPCADGFTTIGSFDVAFDGTQSIDLGAGQQINTLRIAGDKGTEIYSVTITYADGETQTIACNRCGSFETNLGGNLVTYLRVNADHASRSPLQIQIA
jgi:hypothetical protein